MIFILIIILINHHDHHHKRCALTWEWQNVSWHKLMGQVLSDKKKRDVYDRFGEEGLKTNNGGGGGGGDHPHLHPPHHHYRWRIIHPTLHPCSHPQSHTVVTRSTGTRQKRSNNFSGLPTPSRASSTCLAWAPIHTRWSFLSSSAIFLALLHILLIFAPLHILTSHYVIIPGQGFFNDGHTDGMDTDDPFAGWVPPHIAFWQLCLWALPSFKWSQDWSNIYVRLQSWSSGSGPVTTLVPTSIAMCSMGKLLTGGSAPSIDVDQLQL